MNTLRSNPIEVFLYFKQSPSLHCLLLILHNPYCPILDAMADLIPSQPEEDVNLYTQSRFLQGLEYSEARLNRRISPVTQAFIEEYHNVYERAVESATEINIVAVFWYDKILHSRTFLQKELSNSEMELF